MFRILSKFLAIAFFVFPETIVLLLSLPWKLQKSDYGKTIGGTNIPTVISVKWTNVLFFPTILSLLLLALGILITIVALTIMLKVESCHNHDTHFSHCEAAAKSASSDDLLEELDELTKKAEDSI